MDRRSPDPLWRTVVGTVLRAERRLQGLTLREVAAVAGISVPYLSEIERGLKEASSEMLAAAAKALGLGLVDLLARAHDTVAERERRVTGQLLSEPVSEPVSELVSELVSESVRESVTVAPVQQRVPAGPVTACSLRLVA